MSMSTLYDGQIRVYRSDNGDAVMVPAHWMDDPELSKPFRKTPPRSAPKTPSSSKTHRSGSPDNETPDGAKE
jgi:hypothetical protein